MNNFALDFAEIDRSSLPRVGGKGANLGELATIDGIAVPAGFCITTEAYRWVVEGDADVGALIDGLGQLRVDDPAAIAIAGAQLRAAIEKLIMPPAVEREILDQLERKGLDQAYAIRSSATAEDLPGSSFAGQQDSYLNIRGVPAVLDHVRRCWASLFTDRAITYRIRNGFEHRLVRLAVVVQRMMFPEAAGIMFTADPVTSNRKLISIEAGAGLGEAMVSGIVNADIYHVRDDAIVDRKISVQTVELVATPEGGTVERTVAPERQGSQTLNDAQILALAALGRRIEAHFGTPQDIEWCLDAGGFHILQSRPITTLYPVPSVSDGKTHIYMSYGHRQIMTDAFKPLGLSFFALLDEWLGRPPMQIAGGRFYKDMSHELANPLTRAVTLKSMGMVDRLMANALAAAVNRKSLVRSLARGKTTVMNFGKGGILPLAIAFFRLSWRDDADVVPALIAQNEASVARLAQTMEGKSGDAVFAAIIDDHQLLTDIMFEPRSVAAAFVGINAANWLNKRMKAWLGEENAADILAQAAAHNVVAAMGFDLLDVGDVARDHPQAIAYLERARQETFFSGLEAVPGGAEVGATIRRYLACYGMHCSGDIDITRTRWSEDPTLLVPLILANIRNFPKGARTERERSGRAAAEAKRDLLLARLRGVRFGGGKARKAARKISLLRHFIGYREYSKHALLQRWWIYKRALLREAQKLVALGAIKAADDVFFLSIEEFRQIVNGGRADDRTIAERRDAFARYQQLVPPRVMTSDGEVISGEYAEKELREGALLGTAVSAGVVEGRARVVLRMEDAKIEPGDILVTIFTDPSWSPLFVGVKAIVMEVGGVMTHGAVIAREYGLPAVVGVENATRRIRDGQRIRVNGSEGSVEILASDAAVGEAGA